MQLAAVAVDDGVALRARSRVMKGRGEEQSELERLRAEVSTLRSQLQ